jgi:hypothetical protein
VFAFFSARTQAKDKIREKDVALIQKFLESYRKDYGVYPVSVREQPMGYERYLESLPQSPMDSDCSLEKYSYENLNQGQSYKLTFCKGSRTISVGPS